MIHSQDNFTHSEVNSIQELYIQALWNEQSLNLPLRCSDGRKIVVKYSGRWNSEAGPDFLGAKILFEHIDHIEELDGDIEIHLHPQQWFQHRHHLDRRYDNTILHVVWEDRPTTPDLPIAVLELAKHIDSTLGQLLNNPQLNNYGAAKRSGSCLCQPILALKSDRFIQEHLTMMGEVRFYKKCNSCRQAVVKFGRKQALINLFAEALGYKYNRQSFIDIVSVMPIKQLKKLPILDTLAIFLGITNSIPDITTESVDQNNHPLIKDLWERWWKLHIGKHIAVDRRGRPANNPCRRLIALALIIQQFDQIYLALTKIDLTQNIHVLLESIHQIITLDDSDWRWHLNLKNNLKNSTAILGKSRREEIIINILLPYLTIINPDSESQILQFYLNHPKTESNQKIRDQALKMLYPPARIKTLICNNGMQQGLIQLHDKVCSNMKKSFINCSFLADIILPDEDFINNTD